MKRILLLSILLFLGFYQSSSQTLMPLPNHSTVYSGQVRGYWFVAPVDFIITGLRVSPQAGTGSQNIQVVNLGVTPPIAFTAQTSNFTTLSYIQGAPNGVIQNVNIPVSQGDVIGILGQAGTSNSYSSTFFNTNIAGQPVTLSRFGYQGNINAGQTNQVWGVGAGQAGNISRVEMYYTLGIKCEDIDLDTAVVDAPIQVCPKRPFGVKIAPNIIGLTYQWQYSKNGGVTWANFVGTANPQKAGEIIDSITTETWYRCKITCTANSKTYTTPARRVKIAPFYYCYCENEVTNDGGADIGNLKVINQTSGDTVLNTAPLYTGITTPLYNNKDANKRYTAYHDSLSWPCLYRDTSYDFVITQAHTTPNLSSTVAQVFLDLNRNGIYQPNERIFIQAINGTGNPAEIAEAAYKIPSNASIGLTGMRVVISEDTIKLDPCDTLSGEGEVEDYIVEICHRPCDGPVTAGIVSSTDTSMCNNYEYTLTDTTYQKNRSGYSRAWEVSGDNISWFSIAGSKNKDTLQRVFTGQPLYYRMYTVCPSTLDTTYSPATLINNKPGYKCYCYSKATGGKVDDSSDIGGVTFGPISVYNGGPHLQNPMAVLPRTDHTDDTPAELFIDSAYSFYVYHTMRAVEHGDAKVTIFIDFDNDHEYDIPNERVFTGYTTTGNHTLIDSIIIPKTVIADVPTGLRVILNNDVGPNPPSDEACGGYTSGETEDFMVIFRNKIPEGINAIANLTGFGIYPNPNSGKFNVQFSTEASIEDLSLKVTTVTGQIVYQNDYNDVGGNFNEEINLTGLSSGVYVVELQVDKQKLIRKLIIR